MSLKELIVITGMSGSGKHTLVKSFEDLGFFCVDNLPVQLIPHLVRLAETQKNGLSHLAIVVDIREGPFLEGFKNLHKTLQKSKFRTHIIYLEASDEVLVKRFSETRRPHPLAVDRTVLEAIRMERLQLKNLRDLADHVVDTSRFTVHSARRFVSDHFRPTQRPDTLITSVVSFGFKYGIPLNTDLLFDVRFLPNPHFVKRLHAKTGNDPAVIRYLNRYPDMKEITQRIFDFVLFLHPRFVHEGKSYLTVSIGCTGGRHRSVAVTNAVAALLERETLDINVIHRDIDKNVDEEP